MKSEPLMPLVFFIKNFVSLVGVLILFPIVSHAQITKNVFVNFELGHGCLTGLGEADTICYDSNFTKFLKNNGAKSINFSNGNLSNWVNYDSSELYCYKYRYSRLHIEEAYFLFPQILFRKRKFYYDNLGRLTRIEYIYNMCCERQTPIPPDNVYFRYDSGGKLKFVLLTLDKKVSKKEDFADRGSFVRKGISMTKLFVIDYYSDSITLKELNVYGSVIKKMNDRKVKKAITKNKIEKNYVLTTKELYFAGMVKDLQKIIFPEFYLMLWGNSWNKGTQI